MEKQQVNDNQIGWNEEVSFNGEYHTGKQDIDDNFNFE